MSTYSQAIDFTMRWGCVYGQAMAWALYRNGELSEALGYIRLALSSGVRDAGIFSTTGTLFEAAGETAESQSYVQAALRINTKHHNFHMHH